MAARHHRIILPLPARPGLTGPSACTGPWSDARGRRADHGRSAPRTATQELPCPARTSPARRPPPAPALVTVDRYDVDLDLTTGPETFRDAEHGPVHVHASPGAETFIDLVAASVEAITLNGDRRSTRPTHYADIRIALPGLAAEQRARRRRHRRATRTPARACTASSTRSTTRSTSTRQFEVADCRRMFAVFEQPDLKATFAFTVTAPGPLAGRLQLPHPRADAGRRRRRHLGLRADPARSRPTSPRSSPAPTTCVRDTVRAARGTVPLGHLLPQVADASYLDADNIFDLHQARLRVLRGGVRLRLPVREVRPALHAGVQHGRDGERRLRHHQRDLRLPLQGHRGPRRAPRADRSSTSWRTCGSATS